MSVLGPMVGETVGIPTFDISSGGLEDIRGIAVQNDEIINRLRGSIAVSSSDGVRMRIA